MKKKAVHPHQQRISPKAGFSVLLSIAFLLFNLPFCLPAVAASHLFTTGILVTLPPDQTAKPEAVVTYIFSLANQTAKTISFKVEAVSSQGWPLLGPAEEFSLPPNSSEYLVCSLLVPSSVLAGTEDYLQLFLSGNGTTKVFTIKTVVQAVRHLKWEPPPLQRAKAGEELFIPVRLTNLGTTTELLNFNVYSEQGWRIFCQTPLGSTLLPGQESKVIISCQVPAAVSPGTLEEIIISPQGGGPETPALSLKILITEQQPTQENQDLVIPLSSYVNFRYLPAEPETSLPWNLTWRSRGDLFPGTYFDFYFTGTHHSLPSTAMYMGLTGEQWALRLGSISHNWDGLVPPPTYTSALYYQEQKAVPWRVWLGPSTAEATPLWWGSSVDLKPVNLRLNYLQNLDPESYYQHALTGEYQLYASPLYGWKMAVQGAIGLGGNTSLTQGGISLGRTEENWDLLGTLKKGRDFYTLTDFDELALAAYTYSQADHRLSSGVTWRNEISPTAAALRSAKLWSELSTGDHQLGYAYTHRSDGTIKEVKAGTTRRFSQNSLSLSTKYSQEDLSRKRQSLLLGGRYRYQATDRNYLETLIYETLSYEDEQLQSFPELGFRWYYEARQKPWNFFGLVQWDLAAGPFTKINALQTGLGAKTAAGSAWQLYTQLYFQEQKPVYSMCFRLQHQDRTFLPAPWCGIHGKAFVDLNRNGVYEQGEPGLADLPVFCNGSQVTVTDKDGNWEIPFTNAGQHRLDLPPQHEGYYTLQARSELTTVRQKSISVLIPYLPPTEVRGQLFIDTNRNGYRDAEEKPLSGIKLAVFDRRDQLITEKSTDLDGAFFLTLLPGEYILELNEGSLAPDFVKPQPLTFEITSNSRHDLIIPVEPREKVIEFFNPEEVFPPNFMESYTEDNW